MADTHRARAKAMGVRSGTAMHKPGQSTARRIVQAARTLLSEKGQAQFSMRNVAQIAGLHLANVQYYFPKRDDLVRALLIDTGEQYRLLYEKALRKLPDDPGQRFERVLQINFDDIMRARTRQFFIQLWALLDRLDGHSGRLLGELYAIDIQQLSAAIEAMHPTTDPDTIERRATLVAAMIEGLMVVRGTGSLRSARVRALLDQAYTLALAIAHGSHSSDPPVTSA